MELTTSLYGDGGALAALAEALIEAAGRARVLAVGDLMLDRFVSGRVDRVSPEAPIPVLAVESEAVMPGGVGNVATNIRALGGSVALVAAIGGDAEGTRLQEMLGFADPAGMVVDPARMTGVKERFLAGGQQLLRADYETVRPVSGAIEERIVAEIESRMASADALVLSDYGKGVLTARVIAAAIGAASARGIPVIVDPKGADYGRYRGADIVTPNLKELAEAAGAAASEDAAVVEAAQEVLARSGIAMMVATRGRDGLSVVPCTGDPVHIRARAREVFDVSGAGDTVVAALALALATGVSAETAARLANLAAGVVVGKVGTASVVPEELLAAAEDAGAGEDKVVAPEALRHRIERWRRRGQRVGFTNGCFDLLHPGHLSLLRFARAACDRLVVGLNSDSSVRGLKGPGRPVSDERARGAVLSALADVDAVVIFDEETPLSLIEAIRPDVLVKGADYEIGQIVGADLVLSYGGEVLRAPIRAGHSTTGIVARMGGGGNALGK